MNILNGILIGNGICLLTVCFILFDIKRVTMKLVKATNKLAEQIEDFDRNHKTRITVTK